MERNNQASTLPAQNSGSFFLADLPGAHQGVEMRPGDLCPRCGREKLDYDGLLNLTCSRCGYTLAGCFT